MSAEIAPCDYKEKMSFALRLASMCWPYLQPILLRLRPIWVHDDNDVGELDEKTGKLHFKHRISIDPKWRLYINPKWVDTVDLELLALIIAGHEVNHVWYKHFKRMESCIPELGNIATDLAINSGLGQYSTAAEVIQKEKYKDNTKKIIPIPMPDADKHDCVMPSLYLDKRTNKPFPENLSAEEYYGLLMDNADTIDYSDIQIVLESNQGGSGKGKGKCKIKVECKCGSGSGGKKLDHELDNNEGNKDGKTYEGDGSDGVSPEEADIIIANVAKEIIEHNNKLPGSVPGHVLTYAQTLIQPPKIRWQDELRSLMRSLFHSISGKYDYTYTKANKRHVNSSIIFPTTIDYRPILVGVLDTSGSMGKTDYINALSEVAGVAQELQSPFTLLQVDAAVSSITPIRNKRDVENIDLAGGGGTDMRIGIEYACKMKPKPGIIVIFTDGFTPWPDEPIPNVKLIAVITGSVPDDWSPPEFIKTLILEDYEK